MSRTHTRRWAAGIATAALAVAVPVGIQVIGQGTASAQTIPNAQVVSSSPVFNSNSPKTAVINCPAGTKIIGGGARVNGAQRVVITQQQPFTTGTGGFRAAASEDQVGFGGNWALQAFAICTNANVNVTIASKDGTPGSGAFQGVSATCPTGFRATGAGGRIDGGQGQVQLGTINEGGLGPNRTTAGGTEDIDGFNGNWNVTSFTVCVQTPNASDFQVVQNQANGNNAGRKIVDVPCPTGKRVTGVAAFTSAGANVEVAVTDANRLRAQAIGRSDVNAGGWSVNVYAICAA